MFVMSRVIVHSHSLAPTTESKGVQSTVLRGYRGVYRGVYLRLHDRLPIDA